jgi:heme-degrading monooxygenase HmoA
MSEIRQGNQLVTQITVVEAEPGKQEDALSVMKQRAQYMAKQPGFVSISLHRSLDGKRIVNYIQWKSRRELEAAHHAPEFRKEWKHLGEVTEEIAPDLYEVTYQQAKAA